MQLYRTMKKIESDEDYKALNALPQAILFVDALWSGVARRSRNVVENWQATESLNSGFSVYVADCDAEAHQKWVNALRPLPDAALRRKLTIGGYGMLTWLQYGSIISATTGNVHPAMVPEISRRTRELFGLNKN